VADVLSIAESIAVLLPALISNASPVLLKHKGTPIDRGIRFIDNRPILGKGKTIEGLFVGLINGYVFTLLVYSIMCNWAVLAAGFLSSIGALLGDMIGAFIKRRLGIPRGGKAPLLDQLDFYMGSLLLLWIFGYQLNIYVVIVFIPIVFILHRATNMVAYRLRLKSVPW